MGYKQTITILFLVGTFFSSLAFSRPISYSEGITIIQENNWNKSFIHTHYSTSSKNSFGFVFENNKVKNTNAYYLQWNHLLHRQNKKNSQLNLYSKNKLGVQEDNNIYSTGISFDWETRRYFVSYDIDFSYLKENKVNQKSRIGIAPYLGDFGELHTWIMLQAEFLESSNDNKNIIFTPLLRFF